jgi:Flp pilus assembly protein TadG
MRRRRTRRRSRGQALVEFALIVPWFVLTFFGAIEMSLIIASLGAYNFAVRDGARVGSILGRTDPLVDTKILANISGHVSGIVMAQATEIDIYRATSDGSCLDAPSGPANRTSVDASNCAKGVYDGSGTRISGPWLVNDRDDALISADYVGVRIVFNYTFLTGFIGTVGTTLTLSSTSAQRIEPQDFTGHHHASIALASGSLTGDGSSALVVPGSGATGDGPLRQPAVAWKEAHA